MLYWKFDLNHYFGSVSARTAFQQSSGNHPPFGGIVAVRFTGDNGKIPPVMGPAIHEPRDTILHRDTDNR